MCQPDASSGWVTRQPRRYDGGVTDDIWLTDREQRAWRSYIGSVSRLKAALARELQRESGLSETDYEVLARLSEAKDGSNPWPQVSREREVAGS